MRNAPGTEQWSFGGCLKASVEIMKKQEVVG